MLGFWAGIFSHFVTLREEMIILRREVEEAGDF